jgi:hypothetical protein
MWLDHTGATAGASHATCGTAFADAVSKIPALGFIATIASEFSPSLCGPTIPGFYKCTYNATIGPPSPCPGFQLQVRSPRGSVLAACRQPASRALQHWGIAGASGSATVPNTFVATGPCPAAAGGCTTVGGASFALAYRIWSRAAHRMCASCLSALHVGCVRAVHRERRLDRSCRRDGAVCSRGCAACACADDAACAIWLTHSCAHVCARMIFVLCVRDAFVLSVTHIAACRY